MKPLTLAQSEVTSHPIKTTHKQKSSLFGTVDDAIIIGKAKEWHKNKGKYTNDHWNWGMKWLRDYNLLK